MQVIHKTMKLRSNTKGVSEVRTSFTPATTVKIGANRVQKRNVSEISRKGKP